MRRLTWCVVTGLLVCISGPCFGRSPQAIGETIQIQANTPAPVPGRLVSSSRSGTRHAKTASNGQIITIAKGHYQPPPAKTKAGKPAPAFIVHGGDDDADRDVNDPAHRAPQANAQTTETPTPPQKPPEPPPLKDFRDSSPATPQF